MTVKLYDSARSPNARKVRLLAAELGVPLELVRLDFAKGEYKSAEYLAKNPNGKVPTLDDDGFCLWESAAILRYLAAKHPEKGLAPSDAKAQAAIDQWLFWWSAHAEAALLELVVEKLVKPFRGMPGNDPSIVAHAQGELARFLPVLDAQLASREYVRGAISVVDFAIAPWLEVAPGLGVDLAPHANVRAWLARLAERPYWKST